GFRCPSSVGALPGCSGFASQVKEPPMAFNGRHQHRWLDRCGAPASTGTEIDWMNFYYAVHTTGGSSQFFFTQFRDTYRQACGGGNCSSANPAPTWSNLVNSVRSLYGVGSGRALHWEAKGPEFRVDQ